MGTGRWATGVIAKGASSLSQTMKTLQDWIMAKVGPLCKYAKNPFNGAFYREEFQNTLTLIKLFFKKS